jgi:hypothetical protein
MTEKEMIVILSTILLAISRVPAAVWPPGKGELVFVEHLMS